MQSKNGGAGYRFGKKEDVGERKRFRMEIGQVIRRYRKMKNMTQEEMADRLGVSGPAVNKWEKGNSFPDITMLAPIARLLDITPDVLLSFREEMTQEEIRSLVVHIDGMLRDQSYEEAFLWAKKKVEQYPDCEELMLNMAVILHAHGVMKDIHGEEYDRCILKWYGRALESRDETVRTRGADGLFGFYRGKEQYEKAKECLAFFSKQNPERKRKMAEIYGLTGRQKEAYKAYEELLFSAYQTVNAYFGGIYGLAAKEGDMEKARMAADKMRELARLFDMGEYYEASAGLELAVMEQDGDRVIEIMEKMLSGVAEIERWRTSPLYEHMAFREVREEFWGEVKRQLKESFGNEEAFGFLKEDERWRRLTGKK